MPSHSPSYFSTRVRRQSLIALGMILACGASAQAQVSVLNCGTENGRTCTPSDAEYGANNVDGTGQICDYGLKPNGNICVNDNRHTFADYRGDPVGKALHDQLYSIQADQPLNHDVFLGTHNSFSSYRADMRGSGIPGVPFSVLNAVPGFPANVTPQLLADQELSISDQLASGARFLVLHPHFYQEQLRVCHDNFSDSVETEICDAATQGRLFAYAVQEISAWLDNNPGEFVVLRLLHDVGKYGKASQLATILNTYFGSKIYRTDSNVSPFVGGFPSLRQLRSQGKQIMIIGTETEQDDPGNSLSQVMWDWGSYVMNDGYTDADGWSNCQNTAGASVPDRPIGQFAFVGEDRSGSNALNDMELQFSKLGNTITNWWDQLTGQGNGNSYFAGGVGLLNAGDMSTAVGCSYGLIALDFWAAGPSAYHGIPIPGITAISQSAFDYRFPNPDQRQANSLWTFQAQNSPALTQPAPVSTDGLSGWHPDSSNSAYQYLCANITQAVPNRELWLPWKLQLSGTEGPWSGGELNCQLSLGPGWHFWAPETPTEMQHATVAILNGTPGQHIWLNMKVAGPNQRPPLVVTPASSNIYWQRGTAYPSLPYIFTKGGTGGALSVSVTAPAGETIFTQAFNNASSIIGAFDNTKVQRLSTGDHYNNIVITETDPVYGSMTYTYPIMLEVDENIVVTPTTTMDLDNCKQVSQTTSVTAGGPFTLQTDQPWLSATASAYNTQVPATLTIGYQPAGLAPGSYVGHVIVSGPYAKNNSVTITVYVKVYPQTTILTTSSGITLTVDGSPVTPPARVCWTPNSRHNLAAPGLVTGKGGSGQMFYDWQTAAGNLTNPVSTVTATSTDAKLVADYRQAYQVTAAANPPAGGSVTGAGWYMQDQKVTLMASPSSGFVFGGFTDRGVLRSNPDTFQVSQAVSVTANFTQQGGILFANTAGQRTDNSSSSRNVPLQIVNMSRGGFGAVQVTGIDGFQTISGTGAVQLVSAQLLDIGDLAPGASGAFTAQMNWPASATRVRFTVHFSANGGAYTGSTTLTVNR